MRYEMTASTDRRMPRGPLAVPGDYTLRLTIGPWTATQPLTLRVDPRLADDGVTLDDLGRQFEVSRDVHELLTAAYALLESVQTARASATGEKATALRRLESELATREQPRYSEPKVIDQLRYLYGILDGADQAPGRDAIDRAAELREQVRQLTAAAAELDAS
jgi:hypothetical protein